MKLSCIACMFMLLGVSALISPTQMLQSSVYAQAGTVTQEPLQNDSEGPLMPEAEAIEGIAESQVTADGVSHVRISHTMAKNNLVRTETSMRGDTINDAGDAEEDKEKDSKSIIRWIVPPRAASEIASLTQQFQAVRRRGKDTCGFNVPLKRGECPSNADIPRNCKQAECGQLCEGDNECGTSSKLNNCGSFEVYRKYCEEPGSLVKWVRGEMGAICKDVCGKSGRVCDINAQSQLTTNEAVGKAFLKAGYECKSYVAGGRSYAGTPFSASNGVCCPMSPGSISACYHNNNSKHAPLCACKQATAGYIEYVGKGCSGRNELGSFSVSDNQFSVNNLADCADRCTGNASCISFEYFENPPNELVKFLGGSEEAYGADWCTQSSTCQGKHVKPIWDYKGSVSGISLYVKDSTCFDDKSFEDASGFTCSTWQGYDCSAAESDYGYTKEAQDDLLNKCRKSCDSCEEDPTCVDDKSFKDASGFTCSTWQGYDCYAAESDYGYTKEAQDDLLNKCRKSCDSCEEDPTCFDDKSFKDASGFKCSAWRGYDCYAAENDHGYTKEAQDALLNKCRKSCGSCEEEHQAQLQAQLVKDEAARLEAQAKKAKAAEDAKKAKAKAAEDAKKAAEAKAKAAAEAKCPSIPAKTLRTIDVRVLVLVQPDGKPDSGEPWFVQTAGTTSPQTGTLATDLTKDDISEIFTVVNKLFAPAGIKLRALPFFVRPPKGKMDVKWWGNLNRQNIDWGRLIGNVKAMVSKYEKRGTFNLVYMKHIGWTLQGVAFGGMAVVGQWSSKFSQWGSGAKAKKRPNALDCDSMKSGHYCQFGLAYTTAHELGHLFGLGHTDRPSLMSGGGHAGCTSRFSASHINKIKSYGARRRR